MEREQTTIRIPEDEKKRAQKIADELGLSFNEFVMLAVDDYIKRHPDE